MNGTPTSVNSFAEEEKGEFATAAVKEVDDLSDRERKDRERRLVRKLDLRIMPWLALAYLVTSLDRANAGNAKVAGLTTDLELGTNDFSIATCLFIIFDIPASLAVRRFGFRLVPYSIIIFGIFTIGMAFLKNREGFMGLRFALGAAEAAVLPGNAAILARYYRREEVTVRVGFFLFSAAYMSGGFGGLLAAGFISLNKVGPLHTWRFIFLYEGVITVAVGILLCFLYPSDPATTKMLNDEERALALSRLSEGQLDGSSTSRAKTPSFKEIVKTITHPQILAATLFFIYNNVTVQGLNSFLPTVVRLNYPGASNVTVQLYTVPPNVFAFGFAMIMAYTAMRFKQHALCAIIGGLMSTSGYGIWVATDSTYVKTRYAAIFLNNGSGFYGPLILAWAMSNAKSDQIRALTGAAVSGFGAIGSVISPWTYLASTAKSGYRPGNSTNLAFSLAVVVGVAIMRTIQVRLNKKSGPNDFKYIY